MHAGDIAPVRELELTRTDLVMYAGASKDFNPMHHDETKAHAAGMASVFGHGMFSMGFLGSAIEDFVGVGAIKTFKVRFVKQTWPGEVLRTSVVVTDVRDDGSERIVELDCSLTNADGEQKVSGTATATAR